MRRLTENLRRDGALSSAPLIYGDRIISGHHRVEAAIKAGIVEADCLSIEGDVDEGRLTAIQLSHNSLSGEDDPEVLRQMLESLLPLEQAYAAVLDMEVPKPPPLRPSIGTPDTVTVAVTFTPPDVEEIRRVADLSLFAQIEPLDQMRDFLEAVFAVKLQTTSTNRLGKPGVLTTMARLSQWALENGYLDSERGKDSRKGWVMARPTKLTPEVHEAIVDGINAGLTFRLSCARAGVTSATFYNWLKKGEAAQSGALMEFFDAVERAKADSALRLISQITLQAPADWRAAAFILERRFPDDYGRRAELTGKAGGPVQVDTKVQTQHVFQPSQEVWDQVLRKRAEFERLLDGDRDEYTSPDSL